MAVLKVLSDILMAIDKGDLAMLVMLDLSAAYNSVDQSILLRRLHISDGLDSLPPPITCPTASTRRGW